MLLFAHNIDADDPGFTVVDTEAGISEYADVTSIWCNRAHREPEAVAREMIEYSSLRRHDLPLVAWGDKRRLNILKAAHLIGACGSCE